MNLVKPEICTLITEWCQYHYKDNLVGITLFDPTSLQVAYPSGDINVLLVLHNSPDEDRKRYDKITQILINNLVQNKQVTVRIQTTNELMMLREMKLPLLDIYLQNSQIIFDPDYILQEIHNAIACSEKR